MNLLVVDPTRRSRSFYNQAAARTQNLGKFRHLVSLMNHLHQYGVNIHYASYLPTNISEEGGINYYNLSDRETISDIKEDVVLVVNDPAWAGITTGGARRFFLPLEVAKVEWGPPECIDTVISLSHTHTRTLAQGLPEAVRNKIVVASFGIVNELYREYPDKVDKVLFIGGYSRGLHQAHLFWNAFGRETDGVMEFAVVAPYIDGPDIEGLTGSATLYHDIPHAELVQLMSESLFAIRPPVEPSFFDSTALECMCASTPVISFNYDDHFSELCRAHEVGIETRPRPGVRPEQQVHDLVRASMRYLESYDLQLDMADKGANLLLSGVYDWRENLNSWVELLCT